MQIQTKYGIESEMVKHCIARPCIEGIYNLYEMHCILGVKKEKRGGGIQKLDKRKVYVRDRSTRATVTIAAHPREDSLILPS